MGFRDRVGDFGKLGLFPWEFPHSKDWDSVGIPWNPQVGFSPPWIQEFSPLWSSAWEFPFFFFPGNSSFGAAFPTPIPPNSTSTDPQGGILAWSWVLGFIFSQKRQNSPPGQSWAGQTSGICSSLDDFPAFSSSWIWVFHNFGNFGAVLGPKISVLAELKAPPDERNDFLKPFPPEYFNPPSFLLAGKIPILNSQPLQFPGILCIPPLQPPVVPQFPAQAWDNLKKKKKKFFNP